MDPRMLQAGIAMGAGLLLLLPTFNALNWSYAENVSPPPWMPTPNPESFDPDDIPDDWTPPEGYEPPPDMEIPEEWKEKYKDKMPPGGWENCPPPAVRRIQELSRSFDLPGRGGLLNNQAQDFEEEVAFALHETAVAFRVYVNVTDWAANGVRSAIVDRNGVLVDAQEEQGEPDPGFIGNPSLRDTEFVHEKMGDQQSKRGVGGAYVLDLEVDQSYSSDGRIGVTGHVALACGGMLAR